MHRTIHTIAVLGLGAALGCGGDPVAEPSGPGMGSRAAEEATAAPIGNRAPVVHEIALVPPRPGANEPVRAEVRAEDPDGDALSLQFDWRVGSRSLDVHGDRVELAGARKGDSLQVRVVASDGHAHSNPVEHRTRIGNRPPRIDGVSLRPSGPIHVGLELQAHPLARDADDDVLSFEFSWLVNDELRDVDGPSFSTDGLRRGDTLQVRVVASDGEDESSEFSSDLFTLENAPPVVASAVVPGSESGMLVYRLPAKDADGDRLRFRLREAPDGMTIAATTGEIRWRPSPEQTGTHTIVVEVDDLRGGVASHGFTLSVGEAEDEEVPAAPSA